MVAPVGAVPERCQIDCDRIFLTIKLRLIILLADLGNPIGN
jgi:hypothetical protein